MQAVAVADARFLHRFCYNAPARQPLLKRSLVQQRVGHVRTVNRKSTVYALLVIVVDVD